MEESQRFIYNTLCRVPPQQWEHLEIEVRKGFFAWSTDRRTGKRLRKTRFVSGIQKNLFDRMETVFRSAGCAKETETYDIFVHGLRITVDASNGQIISCIQKQKLGHYDDFRFLRYSAALEIPQTVPKKIMSVFQTVHPWQNMKSGTPVRLTSQVPLRRGLCSPDDPLVGQMSHPSMLWTLTGYPFETNTRPTSTIILECLPGRVGDHCYPQAAYSVHVFPRSTCSVTPFSRTRTGNYIMIRKKKRRAYRLGYGIQMHFTEVRQHPDSLVDIELQPTVYEIEFEICPRRCIVHRFFPNEFATIHIVVDEYIPQFVKHTIQKIPQCHIHVFEDTFFGLEVVPLFMEDTHVACVHDPHFLIGNVEAFTQPLHPRKSRIISQSTELKTKRMLVNGTEFSEKANGKFTDVRTMKRAKYKSGKRKRKRRQRYYHIESVDFKDRQVSVYTLKPHFEYIAPFGFQVSELFCRDVAHLIQNEPTWANIEV